MAPKFGTSGLRGLVVELTPDLVADHVRAFVHACDTGGTLYVGQDLRPSSPDIAETIMSAAAAEGLRVVDCGALPTPALALAALKDKAGAIMVTGSHIPADRNGLKFYSRKGEITKEDEAAIGAAIGRPSAGKDGLRETNTTAGPQFIDRYIKAFGDSALAGQRIGLYAHSAVGRDDLAQMLRGLGAEVIELGRSETFIPVDTEAVDPDTRAMIRDWVTGHGLHALVSTDGDSDRPLLADETGTIVPGDIMGQITAEALGAQAVVTPVSSNSGVTQKGFATVALTQIGSPYVIAKMEELGGAVAGYEANGGFLLGFTATAPAGTLGPLVTRDCMLPLIMTLVQAGQSGVSARVAQEPPVVTIADRLQEVPQSRSQPFVSQLRDSPTARAAFLAKLGVEETACDLTDGVRMQIKGGGTVHVRPSGNAPELRLYIEGADVTAADALMQAGLQALREELQG